MHIVYFGCTMQGMSKPIDWRGETDQDGMLSPDMVALLIASKFKEIEEEVFDFACGCDGDVTRAHAWKGAVAEAVVEILGVTIEQSAEV